VEKKRAVAKKVRIFDLVNGVFFHGSKLDMRPNYLITPYGEKISRVNLIGTVIDVFISEDENYGSLTLDDGSASIRAKVFGDGVKLVKKISNGDLALVVGKLKEYNGEIYVAAEVVRKLDDLNHEILRKIEILKDLKERKKIMEEIRNLIDQMSEEELKEYVEKKYGLNEECLNVVRANLKVGKEIDYKPKILEIIASMDKGEGVEISKIFELIDLPERIIENVIDELLSSGELFEPKPGFFKRVKT